MSGAGLHATCTWVLNSEGLIKRVRSQKPKPHIASFVRGSFVTCQLQRNYESITLEKANMIKFC